MTPDARRGRMAWQPQANVDPCEIPLLSDTAPCSKRTHSLTHSLTYSLQAGSDSQSMLGTFQKNPCMPLVDATGRISKKKKKKGTTT